MFDCHKEMLSFHDNQVRLPKAERDNMRGRRDANRNRVKSSLNNDDKPVPYASHSQGGYAMWTMTQDSDLDYDIDDGVYFNKDDLVGPLGGEMSPLAVRHMVRDAVDDGSFKTPPVVLKNCVRVQYDPGYHVDIPIYRRCTEEGLWGIEITFYELASSSWRRSDARANTDWFLTENTEQSPNATNGGQMRRVVRYLKSLARSRTSWKAKVVSGFQISALVAECYRANDVREDSSLYDTMNAIHQRLLRGLGICHPVLEGTMLSGDDDARAAFFRDRLKEQIDTLAVLFEHDCDREKALKAWDKAFNTSYFIDTFGEDAETASSAVASQSSLEKKSALVGTTLFAQANTPEVIAAVDKNEGGNYG